MDAPDRIEAVKLHLKTPGEDGMTLADEKGGHSTQMACHIHEKAVILWSKTYTCNRKVMSYRRKCPIFAGHFVIVSFVFIHIPALLVNFSLRESLRSEFLSKNR
jgi:hypothetical protein